MFSLMNKTVVNGDSEEVKMPRKILVCFDHKNWRKCKKIMTALFITENIDNNGLPLTCIIFFISFLFIFRRCTENVDGSCPECGIPTHVKDIVTNRQLKNTVSLCKQLTKLLNIPTQKEQNSNDHCSKLSGFLRSI